MNNAAFATAPPIRRGTWHLAESAQRDGDHKTATELVHALIPWAAVRAQGLTGSTARLTVHALELNR